MFVNLTKEQIELSIIEYEQIISNLKQVLESGNHLDFSKCERCGGTGYHFGYAQHNYQDRIKCSCSTN